MLFHEHVDDMPLLIEFLQKLHLSDILDRHLDSHVKNRGLEEI